MQRVCEQICTARKGTCLLNIGEVQFRKPFPKVAVLSEDVLLFLAARSVRRGFSAACLLAGFVGLILADSMEHPCLL